MTLNKPTLFYLGFVNNQLNLYISIVKIYLENKIGKILHIPQKVVSLQSIKKKKIVKVAFGLLMVNQYVIFIADVKQ